MANAVLGEPLGLRHAVALWGTQSEYGTPAAPTAGLGPVRARLVRRDEVRPLFGAGAAGAVAWAPGATYAEWVLHLPAVLPAHAPLLQSALRTGGVLPLLTLALGYQDDGDPAARAAEQVQDCKAGRLELELDASRGHGPLTATVAGLGGRIQGSAPSPVPAVGEPWCSHQAVALLDTEPFALRSLRVRLEHRLSRDHVLPGTAPAAFPRGHRYLTEHDQRLRGTLSRYAPAGVAGQAAAAPAHSLLVELPAPGGETLRLQVTGCRFTLERLEADERGLVWTAEFEAGDLAVEVE